MPLKALQRGFHRLPNGRCHACMQMPFLYFVDQKMLRLIRGWLIHAVTQRPLVIFQPPPEPALSAIWVLFSTLNQLIIREAVRPSPPS